MAFSEFEIKRYQKIVGTFIEQRRPPEHLRDQVDLDFRIAGQSLVILERRPVWNDPQRMQEQPIAKATWVKQRGLWKVYWQRADLKWHPYPPDPLVPTLEEFLAVVDDDAYGCFWG